MQGWCSRAVAAQGGTGGASTIIVGKGEGVGMSSRRIGFL